jgi:hypothetical protein
MHHTHIYKNAPYASYIVYLLGFLVAHHVNVYSPKKTEHFPYGDDAMGSQEFEPHRLSQRQLHTFPVLFTPFPYDLCLFAPNPAVDQA